MRPALLGIIGCGAMGRLIARHIREQLPGDPLGENDGQENADGGEGGSGDGSRWSSETFRC